MDVFQAVGTLAEIGIARYGGRAAQRITGATLVALAGGVCACAAAAFAVAALWIYLAPELGRAGVAALIAAILAILCLSFLVASRSLMKPRPELPAAAVPWDTILREANGLVRDHKGALLLAAVIAGFMASPERPKTRPR